MNELNTRILQELNGVEGVGNLKKLEEYMKQSKGFFYVRSSGHDRWTNGTAQHSWRVYQYMRYYWKKPEEIKENREALRNNEDWPDKRLIPDVVKNIEEKHIILTGLLHDVGKMKGCSHHATKGRDILKEILGKDFVDSHKEVLAAIYLHHHADEKKDSDLYANRNPSLNKLLSIADTMASGTAWNSEYYRKGTVQNSKNEGLKEPLKCEAMDRTCQMVKYRIYLDYNFELCHVEGFPSSHILWNSHEDIVQALKNGTLKTEELESDTTDVITHAHRLAENASKNLCLIVGIAPDKPSPNVRNIHPHYPQEEDMFICTNLIYAFYRSHSKNFRFRFTMRDEISQRYSEQSKDKGIFLPDVTVIRDGASEGFRMVTPWKVNLLLVPGWQGMAILK